MDPALSVEEAPSAAGMPTATVTFSIPNGHTLAKGPTVAKGMLSNRADLLHSYCDEEGCICMEYILNLTWTEGSHLERPAPLLPQCWPPLASLNRG